MASKASFPVSFDKLIHLCIDEPGLSTEDRLFWWPILTTIHDEKTIFSRKDLSVIQVSILQLNMLAKEMKITPTLEHSQFSLTQVFQMLCHKYQIKEYKYLYKLYTIIVDEIKTHPFQSVVAYEILLTILENTTKFGDFTSKTITIQRHILPKLVEKTMHKTHQKLKQIRAYQDEYLHMIFNNYFIELLPKHYMLQIIDVYLLEGMKALHRYYTILYYILYTILYL
jgi:hypothetical protein